MAALEQEIIASTNGPKPSVVPVDARDGNSRRRRRRQSGFIKAIRQEPVQFQGLVQATLTLVVSLGLIGSPEVKTAVLALSAAFLAFFAKNHVTPVRNAHDHDGNRLVPAKD